MLMYAFTRTPVGRMCNAVRDNPERAEFVGYNTQRVRFIAFAVAGLFAGLAGGLHAINYEIVAADAVERAALGHRAADGLHRRRRALRRAGPRRDHAHVAADQPERLHVGAGCSISACSSWRSSCSRPSGLAGLIVMHGAIVRTRAFGGVLARVRDRAGAGARDGRRRGAADRDELSRCRRSPSSARACAFCGSPLDAATPWPWLVGVAAARRRLPAVSRDVAAWSRRRGSAARDEARRPRTAARCGAASATRRCALELRGVHKRFGATPIIRGVSLDVAQRRAPRDHRPQRRRQVDAVQPDQRPLRAHARDRSG